MQRILTKIPVSAVFRNIMRDIRRNALPKIWRVLYGAMFVSTRMATNMTARKQQERLLLRFATKA